MKKILILLFVFANICVFSQEINSKTAPLFIDIQEFCFPKGDFEWDKPEEAGLNAKKIPEYFRERELPVIHIRHNDEPGGSIHHNVSPQTIEKVIGKVEINCYKDTDLLEYLKENKIDTLVICGMQTHMCVEAVVWASYDYGFKSILIHESCTTKDLKYNDHTVKAVDIHSSTLTTLSVYAKLIETELF